MVTHMFACGFRIAQAFVSPVGGTQIAGKKFPGYTPHN
jgi:hypothetical protein